MDVVRAVIIGFGGMGRKYAKMLYEKKAEGMVLAGICCRNLAGQTEIREIYPEVRIYQDVEDTFAHGDDFDAVVIVTPHGTHVEIGKMAARAGKHILVDKPAGVSTKKVKELQREAVEAGVSLGTIFTVRMNAAFEKAKEMIVKGEAGRLVRAVWICNTFYRTPLYHHSAPWRSTWKGESGGLLINQCQHYLDVWQWLLGMPSEVYASVDYGKYNDFTVDDSMDLQFFYDNGIRGTFVSSSGESPGVNRFEIWGTKGRLCIEDCSRLTFDENVMPTDEFAKVNTDIYGTLEHHLREIPLENKEADGYVKLFQNFASHILTGEPLLVDGDDGQRTLMMANGAYLSSWLEKKIAYPIDDELYVSLVAERIDREDEK